jgi:hypothetical protein
MSSRAREKFADDRVQAARDGLGVLRRDDALLGEHGGMGLGAGDVLAPQFLVEVDGGVDLLHDGGGAAAVARAPHPVGHDVILG